MSANKNAVELVESVERLCSFFEGPVEEKARRIAELVNRYYPVDLVPVKAVYEPGNHCVNLSPERIYRLKNYINEEYTITGVKLVSVSFDNGEVFRPEQEIKLDWHASGFRKYTGSMNLRDIAGEIKVTGGPRGGDAISLRYEPHDPNCRVDVQAYQVRLIYVKEPTFNPSTL